MTRRLLELTSILGIFAMSVLANATIPANFPGAKWKPAKPEDVGMSTSKLKVVTNFIKENGGSASSGLVIRQGKLICQWGSIDKMYSIASGTKSFTSTVLGLAIDDGKCSLDDHAYKYLPKLKRGKNAQIKLFHLLTMTSEYGRRGEPATAWYYNDAAVGELARIVTIIHQKSMQKVLKEHIMDVIGAKNWDWWAMGREEGIPVNGGGGGIKISASDLARFGYLFRHNGNWQGKQLISKKWVQQATKSSQNLNKRYGLLWWVNTSGFWAGVPKDSYCALGLQSQYILWVCPSLDMVAVQLGTRGLGDKRKLPVFLKLIVDAATD